MNCDIGFEASVPPGEDPLVVLKQLQDLSESFHKSSFSHLYTESGSPVTFAEPEYHSHYVKQKEVVAGNGLGADIDSCQEVKVLETYKLMVKGKPELEEIYNKKFAELSK